jgi:lipid-A-disaccharide synthase-like uncharacterized protein
MLYAALASLIIGGLIGVFQLNNWRMGKRPNRSLPIAHGVFNVLGLALLLTYAFTTDDKIPTASIVMFLVAATGGLFLFYMDVTQRRIPMLVGYIHGLVALIAIALLLIFVANVRPV